MTMTSSRFGRGMAPSLPTAPAAFAARFVPVLLAPAILAGCRGQRAQSALHPAGPAAAEIAWFWWLLFGVCTGVFVVVCLALLFALLRGRWSKQSTGPLGAGFIVVSGIVIPAVILVVLMFFSLGSTMALRMPETSVTIEVVGHQWWWEIRYPELGIVTANELHIPVGEPIKLEMTSADVIHSFWVPELHGKRDLRPGRIINFWIQASRPGTFRGQCAEYCGLQHALMGFRVVALPPEEFAAWAARRQRPHPQPATDQLRRGLEVFFTAKCHNCHTIRGTGAAGKIGPDLTHIGSRQTLGAAAVVNNRGNLSGWITNPQPIKPGNLMPATYLDPEELHPLVDYLMSLE